MMMTMMIWHQIFLEESKQKEIKVQAEDVRVFLQNEIDKLENTISQKRLLIQQTETEISALSEQISSYEKLLSNEDLILNAIEGTKKEKEIES